MGSGALREYLDPLAQVIYRSYREVALSELLADLSIRVSQKVLQSSSR